MRFDTPERFDVGYDPETGRAKSVVINMLDANHCPGSAMYVLKLSLFLISDQRSPLLRRFLLTDPDTGSTILHTGDVRPDRPFLDRLERHPAVMPYLAKIMGMETVQEEQSEGVSVATGGMFRARKLERVYLDTSAVYVVVAGAVWYHR